MLRHPSVVPPRVTSRLAALRQVLHVPFPVAFCRGYVCGQHFTPHGIGGRSPEIPPEFVPTVRARRVCLAPSSAAAPYSLMLQHSLPGASQLHQHRPLHRHSHSGYSQLTGERRPHRCRACRTVASQAQLTRPSPSTFRAHLRRSVARALTSIPAPAPHARELANGRSALHALACRCRCTVTVPQAHAPAGAFRPAFGELRLPPKHAPPRPSAHSRHPQLQ